MFRINHINVIRITAVITAFVLAAFFTRMVHVPDTVPAAYNNRQILKVELFDRSDDVNGFGTYNSMQLMEWIQHNFGDPNNVDIEFVTVPREAETTELNKYIASGSGPDIVMTYNPYYFGSYAKNGQITDLTELLDTHGQNIKSLIGDEILQNGKIDNRQFAIPAKRMFTGKYVSYIRKDWLEKLGLEMPKNTEELINVLIQFRDKNPGNLSEPVIPFSSQSGNSAAVKTILQNYCMETDSSETVEFSDPEYKRGLQFLNELYNENLLGKDYAYDNDTVTHYTNISEGKVGFFMDSISTVSFERIINICELMKTHDPDAELAVCDAISNKNGRHFKEINSASGMYIFIPSYSTKAELAVKYIDWLSKPEVIKALQSGDIVENGNISGENSANLSQSFDICIVLNGFYADTKEESIVIESKTYGKYSSLFLNACRVSVNDGFQAYISPEEIIKGGNADKTSAIIDKYVTRCITAEPGSFDSVYEQSAAQFHKEISQLNE